MKLLLRCVIASLVFCALLWVMSVLTALWLPALLTWPGIVAVDAVCARLGFYESGTPSVLPWQVPGLLLDVVLYTIVFWVFRVGWQMFRRQRSRRPSAAH